MCISITTNKSRYDSLTWDKEVGIVGEATEFELSNKGGNDVTSVGASNHNSLQINNNADIIIFSSTDESREVSCIVGRGVKKVSTYCYVIKNSSNVVVS